MVLFAFPFRVSSRAFFSPPRPNEHLMVRSFDDDDNRNERGGGGRGGGGAKQMVSHKSEPDKEKNERKQICVCRCDGVFRKQGEGCLTLFVAWVGGGNSIRTNCRLGVKQKKGKKLQQEMEKWQLFFVSLLSLSHLFLRTFANHPPPPCAAGEGEKIADIAHTSAQKRKFLFNNSGRMWGIRSSLSPKSDFHLR